MDCFPIHVGDFITIYGEDEVSNSRYKNLVFEVCILSLSDNVLQDNNNQEVKYGNLIGFREIVWKKFLKVEFDKIVLDEIPFGVNKESFIFNIFPFMMSESIDNKRWDVVYSQNNILLQHVKTNKFACPVIGNGEYHLPFSLTSFFELTDKQIPLRLSHFIFIPSKSLIEPRVLFEKGINLLFGNGIENVNTLSAFSYFTKSFSLGYLPAGVLKARSLKFGIGIPPNPTEAQKLCNEVLKRGLGDMTKEIDEEINIFNSVNNYNHYTNNKKATIALIDVNILLAIGYIYDFGYGIKRSAEKSFNYFMMAAKLFNNSIAQACIGWSFVEGDGVEKDVLTGMNWYLKSAQQENCLAQYHLGTIYINGIGIEKNIFEGLNWLLKSANQNNSDAQFSLGYFYSTRQQGFEDDTENGISWYKKAGEQNNSKALYNLGIIYFNGDGVDKNFVEGIKWCAKAAEQNDLDAQFHLGIIYWRGKGIQKNIEIGMKWLKNAAIQNHVRAQYELGKISLTENQEQALEYFYACKI